MLRDGGYLIFGKANEARVLVQNFLLARPILMSRTEFEAVGSLLATSASVGSLAPSTSTAICLSGRRLFGGMLPRKKIWSMGCCARESGDAVGRSRLGN